MYRHFVLLLAVLAIGCSDTRRDVVVRVAVPGLDSVPAPVPQTPVLALPYDRDSLRAALAEAAPSPRPVEAEAALDTLFARYREPFTAFLAASAAVTRLEDSAAGGHAAVRGRLDSARAVQAEARERLGRLRGEITPRVDSLRAVVRDWEDTAFRDWAARVEELGRPREPHSDETDGRGLARFTLPSGDWWIHATANDPLDPNARWYWNVRLQPGIDTLVLDAATGERQPRY